MPSEMDFITYQDFQDSLEPVETPSESAKVIACDTTDGPVAVPANANALENAATEFDMTEGNVVEVWTPSGKKKLDLLNVGKAVDVSALQTEVAGILAKTNLFTIVSNPEYAIAWLDSNDRFLFGVRNDGTFVVSKYSDLIDGLALKVDKVTGKSLVNDSWANSLVDETNGEYKYAVVDVNDKLLFGIKDSGEFYFAMSSEKVDDEWIKALLSSENDEYSSVTTDNRNRLLDAIRKNGLHEFFTKMKFSGGVDWTSENMAELSNALKAYGILGGTGDWSDAKSLQIPKPKLAIINFTNISAMPTTKTADAKAIMQFWDLNGNYFKKKVVVNAQGNSTLVWPKKNASFDICNDDWVGDDTFKLKIGDWVEQDSFHLKAGYNDFLRSGVGEVCYDFYKQILNTRNVNENRSWKLAMLNEVNTRWAGRGYGITESVKDRSDCGALCFPQGFPCVVYLNDEFYGVFAFQLKKHRDNYMMGKSTKTNIHLDGRLGSAFFTGSINWTDFEVRNPKDLYTMDGNKYDGDDPKELIDPTSASYNPNNSKHVNTYFVKQKIIALSQVYSRVAAEQTEAGKKAIVESVFNISNLVDYQIFCDVTYNYDGIEKNWQWTTWDGDHWFVNAYDLDGCFGAYFQGTAIFSPHTAKMGNVNGLPSKYVLDFYDSALDERYAELRQNKVITTDNIVSMLLGWDNAISKFKKVEFEKWSGASCNKDIVVDSHWEIVEEDGVPVISYSPFADYYNPETAYSVGDVVSYNYTNGFRWAYKLRCVESSIDNPPITTFGFKDSVWRLKTWIDENLENMDTAYSFDNY